MAGKHLPYRWASSSARTDLDLKYAGMFKDDTMFAEVLEIMKDNRRKDDEDPGYL